MLQEKPPAMQPVPVRTHPCRALSPKDGAFETEMARLGRAALSLMGGEGPPILQVTGAGPGVGTSRVVLGLGDALARSDVPVGSFDLSSPVGHDIDMPRLRAPSAGPRRDVVPARVTERYHDPAFDLVILDTPPIRSSALSMALPAHVGGVILVVEADRSTREEIADSLRAIEDCGGRCLGLVLNRRRRPFWRWRR